MRALIVENDRQLSKLLKHTLESNRFAVDVTPCRTTAAEYARLTAYELVVLDTALPCSECPELCERMRAAGRTTAVLVLSEDEDTDSKVEALNAGADDYLAKPFALAEFMARVRAITRRPQVLREVLHRVADVELNADAGVVTRAGSPVLLTRKEFMLLTYLMQNAGRVLSRALILEHVWDASVDPFSNTLESHILTLRRKLGDTRAGQRLIETVSGRGYRMGALVLMSMQAWMGLV